MATQTATHTTLSTTSSDPVFRGPVSTQLNFYNPPADNSAPFNYVENPPEGQPKRNFTDSKSTISVQDARGKESEFALDTHAFQLLQNYPHNDAIDWTDDESIKKHYYPEVEALLLKELPGKPTRVLLFDHTVRRALPNAHRAPVTFAHIDQTSKSALQRVNFHLPADEAEKYAQGRYRIVNVWRPLNGAVETHPLAFADSGSVPDSDMIGVQHRYPDRTGETAAVKYGAGHKWWYWSGVDNDERVLLQCFDSEKPGNRVPHSAFVDSRSENTGKPRQSIEVRALIFG